MRFRPGEKVILVDDLIATGGTAEGAVKLLRQMGADIVAACFVIDLPDLGGRKKLEALDVPVRTLIAFEGPLKDLQFVPSCPALPIRKARMASSVHRPMARA